MGWIVDQSNPANCDKGKVCVWSMEAIVGAFVSVYVWVMYYTQHYDIHGT
jgi:hypothetical protein